KKVFLSREIIERRAFAHAGALGYILKSDGRIPLLGDFIISRFDQLLAPLIFIFLYELFCCHSIASNQVSDQVFTRFLLGYLHRNLLALDWPVSLYMPMRHYVNVFFIYICLCYGPGRSRARCCRRLVATTPGTLTQRYYPYTQLNAALGTIGEGRAV